MVRHTLCLVVTGLLLVTLPATGVRAAGEAVPAPSQDWSFNGLFGTYDRASAQRGLQVYQQVCATCHALSHLSFRHLAGLGFDEQEIEAIAAQYIITDGPDENGEMFERPGLPSDRFPYPYANPQAARAANNGAYPPELSLMVEARPNGANYLHAFLIGFVEPPEDVTLGAGQYWNTYFPGHQVAMPNILMDDGTAYTDGTQATVAQQAWDVTNFLAWAAEPTLEDRRQMGVRVILFLIVFTGLMYAVKRKIWADVH